jgi:predicted transcriptional regulator YheO
MADGRAPASQRDDERDLLDAVAQIVEPLSRAFGRDCEVVLHDLSNLDSSVYAIGGDLTGRSVGSPPTDLLLQHVLAGAKSNLIGYETVLPDGRRCRSSTIFIRPPYPRPQPQDEAAAAAPASALERGGAAAATPPDASVVESTAAGSGVSESNGGLAVLPHRRGGVGRRPHVGSAARPVGALCINIDVTRLQELHALTGALIGTIDHALPGRSEEPQHEVFHDTINSLASEIVAQAIGDAAAPVHLMKKHHKLEVVSTLKDRGVFQLKDAVDIVSSALGVRRFTIYNYLNELQEYQPEENV